MSRLSPTALPLPRERVAPSPRRGMLCWGSEAPQAALGRGAKVLPDWLQACVTPRPQRPSFPSSFCVFQDITYLRIPLPDTPEANIKRHFKECISFIHQCRLHGGNCLVHCLAGISRSTTVVVAYVMAVTELSCQEVLEAVRTVRPVANPNPGFRQQLAEFGGGAARKVRRHLKQRYGTSPFNDEEEIKALLPAGRGGPSRTEGPRQGLVPRARDIRTTTPFLLRVKRTFSCIPACLK
ncbi:dual specificity protein phosphatase 15 isoform 2-T2 [Morphnus guianensis]